eukprot:858450-Rhodomonas_salina.3
MVLRCAWSQRRGFEGDARGVAARQQRNEGGGCPEMKCTNEMHRVGVLEFLCPLCALSPV